MNRNNLFVVIVFSVFLGLSLFKITESPPLLNQDEASFSNAAYSISKNGRDEHGNVLPLYFDTLTSRVHDWKNPLIVYWSALFMKILGFSVFSARLPAVLMGLITAIYLYKYVILENGNKKTGAWWSLFLLMTTPMFFLQARRNNDPISLVMTLMAQIFYAVKYYKTKESKYLIYSAIAAGLAFYSYSPGRLYGPLNLLISILILVKGKVKDIIKISYKPLIILFLLLLPSLVWQLTSDKLVTTLRYSEMLIPINKSTLINELPLKILKYFDVSFLFWEGDTHTFHNTGRFGVFLISSLPLFLAGMYSLIKKFDRVSLMLFIFFVLHPIGIALTKDDYRAVRVINLLPVFVVICSYGINLLLKSSKAKVIALLVFIFWLVESVIFLHDFYYKFPIRLALDWRYRYQLYSQLEYLVERERNYEGEVYVDNNIWFAIDDLKYIENIEDRNTNIKFTDDVSIATRSGVLFLTNRKLEENVKVVTEYDGMYVYEAIEKN